MRNSAFDPQSSDATRGDTAAPHSSDCDVHGPGGRYRFSDEKSRIDVAAVHRYLSKDSYWAQGRPRGVVERSIESSYCLACYAEDGSLAGFSRVVTDWATVYYICDLFVLPQHRGCGLGKELVRRITEHPELRSLSGMLLTADAHGLYAQFGFEQNEASAHRFMRKPRPPV